jgi:tetrapyrrole methylase family protein/MazG family protein
MVQAPKNLKKIESLVEIVAQLRGPEGCPWDKEQTHQSLTPFLLEEAHEVVEAIEQLRPSVPGADKASIESLTKLKEELGDLLFQVILHSQLASERGEFNLADVIETLNKKMIHRHPHVFSDIQVSSSDEVLKNWETLKQAETPKEDKKGSPFQNIPKALPSLQQAHKIGHKTQHLKFDWQNAKEVWAKVEEEVEELKEAWLKLQSVPEMEHELGDVFFSLAQFARHLNLDPEKVTRSANRRFVGRFQSMLELYASDTGAVDHFEPTILKQFGNLASEKKEAYWQRAKQL